jgi:hypothetical protein
MRNFATVSGKSKGQFYTPAEVSRVIAKVIGVSGTTRSNQAIYDPTCGSGSLLLKAHDEANSRTGLDLAIYGQDGRFTANENEMMTARLHYGGNRAGVAHAGESFQGFERPAEALRLRSCQSAVLQGVEQRVKPAG